MFWAGDTASANARRKRQPVSVVAGLVSAAGAARQSRAKGQGVFMQLN